VILFAWIQARVQTVTATAILAVMAIVLGVSGAHLVQLYHATMAGCSTPSECSTALHLYMNNDSALRGWLGVLVAAGPAIAGIFWGAPMVAGELEAGTFRLAWTQSVTRTTWLVVKLAVVGLAAMATAGDQPARVRLDGHSRYGRGAASGGNRDGVLARMLERPHVHVAWGRAWCSHRGAECDLLGTDADHDAGIAKGTSGCRFHGHDEARRFDGRTIGS
jgi:hypothetical protein